VYVLQVPTADPRVILNPIQSPHLTVFLSIYLG
jgi:hypothetical protein